MAQGGFGGMGVVQLYSPFGQNEDGTNTILDDGIHVFKDGVQVFGPEKQRVHRVAGLPERQRGDGGRLRQPHQYRRRRGRYPTDTVAVSDPPLATCSTCPRPDLGWSG